MLTKKIILSTNNLSKISRYYVERKIVYDAESHKCIRVTVLRRSSWWM